MYTLWNNNFKTKRAMAEWVESVLARRVGRQYLIDSVGHTQLLKLMELHPRLDEKISQGPFVRFKITKENNHAPKTWFTNQLDCASDDPWAWTDWSWRSCVNRVPKNVVAKSSGV